MSKQQLVEEYLDKVSVIKKLIYSNGQKNTKPATLMQYSVLKFVKKNKNSSVSEIAQYVGISKSSATQLIERLVNHKLVTRIHDNDDRRIVHIAIVAKGEAEIHYLKKQLTEKMRTVLLQISEHDLQELIRINSILLEVLKRKEIYE